jgi:hypothetical protein
LELRGYRTRRTVYHAPSGERRFQQFACSHVLVRSRRAPERKRHRMATKAEAYMAELLRQSRPPRPKKVRKPSREQLIDTTLLDGIGTLPHNFTKRSDNRGGAVLESSASGKPSRKSTRKSTGHVKAASELTRRQMRRVSSPAARAARAAVR